MLLPTFGSKKDRKQNRLFGLVICCVLVFFVVAIAVLLSLNRTPVSSPTPDESAPPPSIETATCVYGSWSQWSLLCLEYPPMEWNQVRTLDAVENQIDCDSIIERRPCSIFTGTCLGYRYFESYSVNCIYDVYSNLCDRGGEFTEYGFACQSNSTDNLDFYELAANEVGETEVRFFEDGSCPTECPLSNGSAVPVPYPAPTPTPAPVCTYGEWSSWSSNCIEYPTGNYSQFRSRVADSDSLYCLATFVRRACSYPLCADQKIVPTVTTTCFYNTSSPYLCNGYSTEAANRIYCQTNATNLTHYFDAMAAGSNGSVLTFFDTPCSPECPIYNTSAPLPSPLTGSPSPSTPFVCTYAAWTAWSAYCYEYPTGTFSQIRSRAPAESPTTCTDTLQRQNCSTTSCTLWPETSFTSVFCQYDPATGLCNASSAAGTTTQRCLTNTTNYPLFFQTVPNGTTTLIFDIDAQPCHEECPLFNASAYVAPCSYGAWSAWSRQCQEITTGVYKQSRARTPSHNYCEDVYEHRDCNISDCLDYDYVISVVACNNYNPYTTLCISSQSTRTSVHLCATNATNMTLYAALSIWEAAPAQVYYLQPCESVCPLVSGLAPVVLPPLPSCILSGWTSWSIECNEYPPGTYSQYRARLSLDPASVNCGPIIQRQACNLSLCQQLTITDTRFRCFYASNNSCANSTMSQVDTTYCVSNATNVTHYRSTAVSESGELLTFGIEPCDESCPATNGNTIIIADPSPDIEIGIKYPTLVSCAPPSYVDSSSGVAICRNCTTTNKCLRPVVTLNDIVKCAFVDKCNDNDECTFDDCNATTGVCSYTPKIGGGETINSTVAYYCDSTTGVTYWDAVSGSVTLETSCSDGDPTTIDSYNEYTKTCSHVRLISEAAPAVTSCVSGNYSYGSPPYSMVGNNATAFLNFALDNNVVCGTASNYVCVNSTCQTATAVAPKCYYQAKIFTGEVAYVRDDFKCADLLTINRFVYCAPHHCYQSGETGCRICNVAQALAGLIHLNTTSDCECA